MSKSIDYHEGYIQALTDVEKFLPPDISVKQLIAARTDMIGKILDDMYKAYNNEKK